ncbi:hypothetical protein GWK47_013107 [Chionoecetes opilio]|uniref:Uncharacterized protein n=1 Tax=Chionoecetes opilio TaxID=41210 RepID=A0A8J4Y1E5_CHIOP|nr:hypothetical protein GWK47_013107 [Chionoecetes opilio]
MSEGFRAAPPARAPPTHTHPEGRNLSVFPRVAPALKLPPPHAPLHRFATPRRGCQGSRGNLVADPSSHSPELSSARKKGRTQLGDGRREKYSCSLMPASGTPRSPS